MSTKPIWMEDGTLSKYPPLDRSIETDVCIIGAGISGLTTAYLVANAGQRVAVLDKDCVGGGESGRTSAHLSNVLDTRYWELAGLHGEEVTRVVAESHTKAIRVIEEITLKEKIECQLRRVPGFLISDPNGKADGLDREFDAARAAGVKVSRVSEAALLRDHRAALCFEDQAQFHAAAYLEGLAKAVVAAGGKIHCNTRVTTIESGEQSRIETEEEFVVLARHVVLASSTPFNDMFAIHTKQAAYRTYVAAFPYLGPPTPALLWDTADPYHYARLHISNGRPYLLVGGEDHKTGQDQQGSDRYNSRLLEWAAPNFHISDFPEYSWSGQILEPVDGLAFIGRNPGDHPNVYLVSGTSGNGLTYGTIAGLLLNDLIQGVQNPWEKIYDPSRITLGATPDFVAENANVMAQYRDWITPGEVNDAEEVPIGAGAILRQGISKIAVYRRNAGECVQLSAVCPHLGGIVSWNSVEETWDCPCHGSRFSPDGEVINGPASKGLEEVAQVAGAGDPVAA